MPPLALHMDYVGCARSKRIRMLFQKTGRQSCRYGVFLMKISVFTVMAFMCLALSAYAEQRNTVDWVMYLVVRAHNFKNATYSNDGIQNYEFPLYVGYIYSEDSKGIKWNALEKVVEREMKRWAETYSKYDLVSRHPLDASSKVAWKLSDYDFFDAAQVLIVEETGFYPVRYERNATIDPDWRPVFASKFRYTKEDADALRIAPMPKKYFTPLNWDQDAYSERMEK